MIALIRSTWASATSCSAFARSTSTCDTASFPFACS
jgi:hypothetical protein